LFWIFLVLLGVILHFQMNGWKTFIGF